MLADLVDSLGWTMGFVPGFCVLSRGRNHTEPARGKFIQNNSSTQRGCIKLSVSERRWEEGEVYMENIMDKKGRKPVIGLKNKEGRLRNRRTRCTPNHFKVSSRDAWSPVKEV